MAVETAQIMEGFYSYLTGNSTFNTAMGGNASTAGRIRYGWARRDLTLPYAIIDLIDSVPFDSFAKDGMLMRVQVTIIEDKEAGVDAVAAHFDKLVLRLHGNAFTATGQSMYATVLEISRGPFFDDNVWRIDGDFAVRGFET